MQRSKSVGAKTEVNETALKICRANSLYSNELFDKLEAKTGLKRSDYKTNAAYVATVVEKQLTDIRNEVESWLPRVNESWFNYKWRLRELKLQKLKQNKYKHQYVVDPYTTHTSIFLRIKYVIIDYINPRD